MEHELIKSFILNPSNDKEKLLETELEEIFQKIKNSDQILDAEKHFTRLDQIQFELARGVFKEGIVVSNRLRCFITDFDRLDDKPERERLYKLILENAYTF